MTKTPITTSVFELFKIGPGPSSSHTIGPMKAAKDFISRIRNFNSNNLQIKTILYGSLAATGIGHGTDKAILAGLLNKNPEECNPKWFSSLFKNKLQIYKIFLNDKEIDFQFSDIVFEKGKFEFPHPNTMQMQLIENNILIHQEEYYSIGGGFIIRKGDDENSVNKKVKYQFSDMTELKELLIQNKLSISDLIIENEISISGLTKSEIKTKMFNIINFMFDAVKRGIETEGILPGSIQLHRKAPSIYNKANHISNAEEKYLIFLNAYCEAASEENACGNIVVTAPTSGASGVLPGIIYFLKNHKNISTEKICESMFVASAIGFLVKHNASISGAEMGCMGEIGTASAMGAALFANCFNEKIETIEASAEIALEHHLGMTCDPIGGYVQIPCIERNAMGAVKAYNSYLLASAGNQSFQKISLDNVIKVMKITGQEMSKKYKETSEAGLAGLSLNSTEC